MTAKINNHKQKNGASQEKSSRIKKVQIPPVDVFESRTQAEESSESATETESSPLDKYSQYRISHTSDIPNPIILIKMNGEVIATEGNTIVISGNSKSGKSALTAWIIACAIAAGMLDDCPEGLEVEKALTKAIIHIDTEQARHKHLQNIRSVWQRAGFDQCPDNLLSYNIRQLELSEYQSVTDGICQAANEVFGGIHFIVIDGIADYIADVNDSEQSNGIVKYVESLAITYRVPVIVIIHTNPGSDKERGHVGSQFQRKCESLLGVRSENDISYVEPKLLRNASKGSIPQMQFIYDKSKGYHVGCGVRSAQESNQDAERLFMVKDLCAKVFAPPAALKYEDAILKIIKHSGKKDRTAKDIFKEMNAHEYISKDEQGYWRIKT